MLDGLEQKLTSRHNFRIASRLIFSLLARVVARTLEGGLEVDVDVHAMELGLRIEREFESRWPGQIWKTQSHEEQEQLRRFSAWLHSEGDAQRDRTLRSLHEAVFPPQYF